MNKQPPPPNYRSSYVPGWDHGNGIRNATCADTQTSTEWPYCPFAMLCRRSFDKAETYTRQGIVAQRVIM